MSQHDSQEFEPEIPRRDNCQHTFQDGRRCRMTRSPHCVAHSQHDRASDDILSQVIGQSGEMITTVAINRVLRNLFVAVLRKRISARDTFALTRLCALLLRTLDDVQGEIKITHGDGSWIQILETAISAAESDSPDEPPRSKQDIAGLLTDGDQN
jgi:hypothetical protein